MVNIVWMTTFVLQNYAQGYILSYSYKLLRALSFFRMLFEVSLKPVYSTMVGKNFRIYSVDIPRKCIESGHFYPCLPPLETLS